MKREQSSVLHRISLGMTADDRTPLFQLSYTGLGVAAIAGVSAFLVFYVGMQTGLSPVAAAAIGAVVVPLLAAYYTAITTRDDASAET